MSNDQPLISIVTLTWNQTEVTCQFLESTRHLTYKNYEILVCDMGSEVDPTERINSANYPNTRVLRSEKNLGFTGGNNWGMRQAKGDYVFIVNNDTEVTPELLDVLIQPFFDDPTIGVTCPKIRFYQQPDMIQYAGFNPINVFTGRTTAVGSKETDRGQCDVSGYTHGAHGCAMLVSREIINKVGMFPENFFIYYEEWDWSARILKAGVSYLLSGQGADLPQGIDHDGQEERHQGLLPYPQPHSLHAEKYCMVSVCSVHNFLYFGRGAKGHHYVPFETAIRTPAIVYKRDYLEPDRVKIFTCIKNPFK
ncbi:glycosyltransferase family 2 protein [Puia sp. P3]|uniref:glycosyltransferase family 2 protein n=1 Tax=Puia sp. P3 TaxID=3423952 RepID=UPI003D66ED66